MLACSTSLPERPHFGALRADPPATRLQVHGPTSLRRTEVEDFIRGVYRERHGAEVRHFAPVLVSLHEADGSVMAAAGYRCAGHGALFLERYLNGPVEACLGLAGAAEPVRSRIVEVGHLAGTRAGAGRQLIMALGPHLATQGFEWVVSTLTQELRHLFLRLGIAPLALGVADPALLGDEAASWGSYYDHSPVVLAGPLALALQVLARRGVRS